MGIKRVVDTAFWTDGKVDDFTPEDKYFMLYLLTNPFTTQLGIYEISIKQVAFQLGYSMDAVRNLIDRFENKYQMIIYSPETHEIAIKNFLYHSIVKGGKPVEDCIKKEMVKVKNKSLLQMVFDHISQKDDLNASVRKIINEFQNDNKNDNDFENDNDNGNENDNENERIVHESSTNRQAYGKHTNVYLSDEEFGNLMMQFPSDYQDKIENLSSYMQRTGKTYADHYEQILYWDKQDKENQSQQVSNQTSGNVFHSLSKQMGVI